jgi:hypothetical protein
VWYDEPFTAAAATLKNTVTAPVPVPVAAANAAAFPATAPPATGQPINGHGRTEKHDRHGRCTRPLFLS